MISISTISSKVCFDILPEALIETIFANLHPTTIALINSVNKQWHNLICYESERKETNELPWDHSITEYRRMRVLANRVTHKIDYCFQFPAIEPNSTTFAFSEVLSVNSKILGIKGTTAQGKEGTFLVANNQQFSTDAPFIEGSFHGSSTNFNFFRSHDSNQLIVTDSLGKEKLSLDLVAEAERLKSDWRKKYEGGLTTDQSWLNSWYAGIYAVFELSKEKIITVSDDGWIVVWDIDWQCKEIKHWKHFWVKDKQQITVRDVKLVQSTLLIKYSIRCYHYGANRLVGFSTVKFEKTIKEQVLGFWDPDEILANNDRIFLHLEHSKGIQSYSLDDDKLQPQDVCNFELMSDQYLISDSAIIQPAGSLWSFDLRIYDPLKPISHKKIILARPYSFTPKLTQLFWKNILIDYEPDKYRLDFYVLPTAKMLGGFRDRFIKKVIVRNGDLLITILEKSSNSYQIIKLRDPADLFLNLRQLASTQAESQVGQTSSSSQSVLTPSLFRDHGSSSERIATPHASWYQKTITMKKVAVVAFILFASIMTVSIYALATKACIVILPVIGLAVAIALGTLAAYYGYKDYQFNNYLKKINSFNN